MPFLYDQSVRESRYNAKEKVPTEHGMFDAKARAEAFARAMLKRGYLIDFGVSITHKDTEVDETVRHFGLDI